MQEWLSYNNLNSIVVATKIDLAPKSRIQAIINDFKKVTNREVFPFSTVNKRYNDALLDYIEQSIL